ncbi:MAG: hypothetical protein F6K26_41670 [Moorea sp. SIO2I5]|nr:hypothetical protein [Moorena sp. SIO2I5]
MGNRESGVGSGESGIGNRESGGLDSRPIRKSSFMIVFASILVYCSGDPLFQTTAAKSSQCVTS